MTGQQPPGCQHSGLAVGWALHALEPAEEILVAAHLPDCAECSRTVAEAELVGAVLGLSVPETVPAAGLEQRVLALVGTAQTAPVPPATPRAPQRPVPQAGRWPTGRPPPTPVAVVRPRAPRRRSRREPLCVPETLKLLLVALLMIALAVTIVFYVIP